MRVKNKLAKGRAGSAVQIHKLPTKTKSRQVQASWVEDAQVIPYQPLPLAMAKTALSVGWAGAKFSWWLLGLVFTKVMASSAKPSPKARYPTDKDGYPIVTDYYEGPPIKRGGGKDKGTTIIYNITNNYYQCGR